MVCQAADQLRQRPHSKHRRGTANGRPFKNGDGAPAISGNRKKVCHHGKLIAENGSTDLFASDRNVKDVSIEKQFRSNTITLFGQGEEEDESDDEDASSTNSSDFSTPMSSAEFIRTHITPASDSGKDTVCCSSNNSDLFGRELQKEGDAVLRLDDMCRQLRDMKQRQRKEVFIVRVTRVTSILRSEGHRKYGKLRLTPLDLINQKSLVRIASGAKSVRGSNRSSKKKNSRDVHQKHS